MIGNKSGAATLVADKSTTKVVPLGYKQTKVGVIPEEWEVVRLENLIAELEAGISVNSTDDFCSSNADKGILKTSAVSNGRFISSENKKIIQKDIDRAKLNPKKGNLIISRMNTPELVGAIAIVEKDFNNLYLPDRLWQTKFFDINSQDSYWLNYLLNTSKYKAKVRNLATGTSGSMKNISKKAFLKIEIPLPPLKEQQKIAQILTTWDDAISKQEALIEAKEQLKKGLMQKLLSGEVRFTGFDEEWEEVRLGDIFDERSRRFKDLKTEEVKQYSELLSVGINSGVTKRSENDAKDNSSSDKGNYKILDENDIVYNTMRMWQGASGVSTLKGIVSPAYTIVHLKDNYCIDFFGLLFKAHRVVFDFYRYSQGLTSDTWNLKYPHFSEVKVKIPTTKLEQQKIAQVFATADKEIALLKEELEILKEQKRGLMQKLLMGEVRVRV